MTFTTAYFVAAVVLLLWSVLLWLDAVVGSRQVPPRPVRGWMLGGFAVGAAVLPLGEFTLWRWLLSVHANPSVVLVGFLLAFVVARLGGRPWLSVRDRRTAYALGAVAGTVLYGSATGFLVPDLYASAWEGRTVVIGVGVVALALIAAGNRTGILLAAALAGQVLDLIESNNTWDYVIDPMFWGLSVWGMAHLAATALATRFRRRPTQAA